MFFILRNYITFILIQNLRVYRYNFCNNYDDAKDYYDNTLNKAADCEDQRPKATA